MGNCCKKKPARDSGLKEKLNISLHNENNENDNTKDENSKISKTIFCLKWLVNANKSKKNSFKNDLVSQTDIPPSNTNEIQIRTVETQEGREKSNTTLTNNNSSHSSVNVDVPTVDPEILSENQSVYKILEDKIVAFYNEFVPCPGKQTF